MNFNKRFILCGILSIALWSCSTFQDDGRVSEGTIEYAVTYPKLDPNSILAELLPTKMEMKFKDNQMVTDLAAGFGMFRMNVISFGDNKEIAQMVKLINERFTVRFRRHSFGKSADFVQPNW